MKSPVRTQTGILVMLAHFVLLLQIMVIPSIAAQNEQQQYAKNLQAILDSRNTMQATLNFIEAHPAIFPAAKVSGFGHQLDREQRLIALQTWQTFLDQILFLDSLGRMHDAMYRNAEMGTQKRASFFVGFGCFLTQYRFALAFIDRMEKNPAIHIMLNEPIPELGLASGRYADFKYRFLNVIRGAEFARLNGLYTYYRLFSRFPGGVQKTSSTSTEKQITTAIKEDIGQLLQDGRGKGVTLTAKNALKIVGDFGLTTWFPVQKGVAELMGDIKVWRPSTSLITPRQISQLIPKLQPGDILLQRREWYATNIGIPGFWSHAALYIGAPNERTAFFQEPALKQWLREQGSSKDGGIDTLLADRYPDHYPLSVAPQENHIPRVIEAIGEGVSFTTLEHSASADSLVILRPNLPKKVIAQAILRAFHYIGRPYDFNFDFRTDAELVCSELIFKAYQQSIKSQGLNLPLSATLGRPLISPNAIAELFDREYGSAEQQLTFVAFLDGYEPKHRAVESTVEAFRKSWKRPNWHVWLQGEKVYVSGPLSP